MSESASLEIFVRCLNKVLDPPSLGGRKTVSICKKTGILRKISTFCVVPAVELGNSVQRNRKKFFQIP